MTNDIRVAIVDDHAIVRQGLRTVLTEMNLNIVGEAASGTEAIRLAEALQPDVMLLDIRMKDGDGLSALPHIKAASPTTAVIILTTYSNPTYFSQAVQAGATGYLLKEAEPEEIASAIQSAATHRHLFNPELLNLVLQQTLPTERSAPPFEDESRYEAHHEDYHGGDVPALREPLSERERDVLSLMVQGDSNADIAEKLMVSITTVKTHVAHIFQKLDVRDRTQAVVVAMRHNLLA